MKLKYLVSGAIALSLTTVIAAAGPTGNGKGGGAPGTGENPGGNGGFVEVVVQTETQAVYMGMSNRLAPNARAAASRGTRIETTTVTRTINGPKGQVDNFVSGNSTTCNNCEITETSVTQVTKLPGNRRVRNQPRP